MNRPITDAELALVQMVVDARNDSRRIPDEIIRGYATRVAAEAVSEETLGQLQALYNAMEQSKNSFNDAMDELPNYARGPTLTKLKAAWEAEEADQEESKP